jgi:predicted nucleic acid-binding protein
MKRTWIVLPKWTAAPGESIDVKRLVLDTSVLLRHWHRSVTRHLERSTMDDASKWARELIAIEETDAIVTPVAIEVICGVRTAQELRLTRAFLDELRVLDGGDVTAADWNEARRLGERIPRDGRPRQLGDCLIQAIARRFKFLVRTFDTGTPR